MLSAELLNWLSALFFYFLTFESLYKEVSKITNATELKKLLITHYENMKDGEAFAQMKGDEAKKIVLNAIEAMDEHGILQITTRTKNRRCTATITDNGRGMTKADVGRLFEPYFTTKEKGTGLGLTNTQNIILSHGASISAESTPGKGTTFTLSFDFA